MKRTFAWVLGNALVVTFAFCAMHDAGRLAEAANRAPNTAKAAATPQQRPASGCQDADGDGFGRGCARGPDCNDRDATINPAQTERCNFRDDNCNGLVDDHPDCKAPPINRSTVSIPAGSFVMGSTNGQGNADEHPQHVVEVKAFRIDRHEVTNAHYAACVAAGACKVPSLRSSRWRKEYYGTSTFADYPVIFVGWSQAASFCRWAGGSLPTEAQWEKAARGPSPAIQTYPWGNQKPDCRRANMGGKHSCVGDTDRIGRRLAGQSPYGVHDMAGNVWEWTADWYNATYYRVSPKANPRGPAKGRLKVMRGGCWLSGADSLRVSCRKAELPSAWAYNVGFRCAYGR